MEKPELQSQLKQKSAGANKSVRLDVVQGTIHVIDIQCLPGVFKKQNIWSSEIRRRRNELMEWVNASGTNKIFRSIIKTSTGNPRLDGRELQRHIKTKTSEEHVKTLRTNPGLISPRLSLVQSINRADVNFNIEVYRDNLFHALVPFTLGFCSTQVWNTFVSTYQVYLEKLRRALERKKSAVEKQIQQSDDEERARNEEYMRHLEVNAKVLKRLLEFSKRKEAQQFDVAPFYISDLYHSESRAKAKRKAMGDAKTPVDTRQHVLTKMEGLMEAVKFFPILYSWAVDQMQQLVKDDSENLFGYIIQGRMQMQSTRLAMVLQKSGEKECLPIVKRTLHSCLEAYGKGKKHVTKSETLDDFSKVLLREYSNASLFLFNLRGPLRVPPTVMFQLMKVSEDNTTLLGDSEEDDMDLIYKVQNALDEIKYNTPMK